MHLTGVIIKNKSTMENLKNNTLVENERMAIKVKRFVADNSRIIIATIGAFIMLGIHEMGVKYFGVVENGTHGYVPLMFGVIMCSMIFKKRQ